MKRLNDNVIVLQAIESVRAELFAAHATNPDNWMETGKILLRLSTLYSLLDVKRIALILEEQDARAESIDRFDIAS